MFHVEIDCFMPRNNISSTAYGHDGGSSLRGLSGSPEGLQCTRLGKVHIPSCRVRGRYQDSLTSSDVLRPPDLGGQGWKLF